MNVFLLTLSILFSTVLRADVISWPFQNIQFTGDRDFVFEMTNALSEIYQTDSGERLIHALKEKRPKFRILKTSGPVRLDPTHLFTIVGNDTNLSTVYHLLSEQFELSYGIVHTQVDLRLFKKEIEALNFQEFIIDDFISVTSLSQKNLEKMVQFIRKIKESELGEKLFAEMKSCGKKLIINDDKSSLSGGGYTGATNGSSSAVFDGRGLDAKIRFRFDQPELGSHLVWTRENQQIPFTYIDNLYHELVHAKHNMCGTLSMYSSEHQAIEEENQFRRERLGEGSSWQRDPSRYEDGVQTWFGLFLD